MASHFASRKLSSIRIKGNGKDGIKDIQLLLIANLKPTEVDDIWALE